jgi:hypothetical protein
MIEGIRITRRHAASSSSSMIAGHWPTATEFWQELKVFLPKKPP